MTPSRLPNRESGPQNQPRAKVAVSIVGGTYVSIGGISALVVTLYSFSALLVSLQATNKLGSAKPSRSKDIKTLIFILLPLN